MIGQVANYMKLHQYQYGFLSTYDETVFFKQETHRFTSAWASANGVRKYLPEHWSGRHNSSKDITVGAN